MEPEILNPRRVPRIPVRCPVEIRDVFTSWKGETEDLGPGGCQIVTSRVVPPGRSLRLSIRCDQIGRTVSATGKVVWVRGDSPVRIGVEFDATMQDAWFRALLAADASGARIARNTLDRLPGRMIVYLGKPPEIVVDFSPDELSVLRSIGDGIPLGALSRALGPAFDRARGALFSLVHRRLVVFDPAHSQGAAGWRRVLGAPALDRAQSGTAPPPSASSPPARPAAPATPIAARPAQAQRLFEEGVALAAAGQMAAAADRFRSALSRAPDDEGIWAALDRLRPLA